MGDSQWWKHFFVMDGTEGEMKFWESEEHFKEMRKPRARLSSMLHWVVSISTEPSLLKHHSLATLGLADYYQVGMLRFTEQIR